MALAQVLLCVSFAPPPLGLLRPSPAALAAPRTSPPQLLDEKQLEQELDVWRLREGMIRGAYGVLVNWKEDEREERAQRDTAGADSTVDATRSAFVASATAVVVGALVLRLGGRAALVSVLGLDMVADLGIDEKVNEFVAYASALGPLSVLGFAAAWVAAKVFLLDFISIGLALSSGILFGGVFQGALLSTTCATLGSLVGFNLSRGNLQKRVESAVQGQPVARALAKVVEEDGFKTVFVLRLAPIIPALPLGAYPYIYGASNLSAVPFATATFLGGIKPYLIDSYVGVFSKQILDGDQMDSAKDAILLVGLGALVLIGVFATELAGETFDTVQAEVKADEKRRLATGEDLEAADTPLVLGPFNSTALTEWLVDRVPHAAQAEYEEVWRTLEEFAGEQWVPAATQAVAGRRRRAAEEKAMPGADSENPIELAPAPSVAQFFYGEDEATAADLAARRRCAEWSVEGGIGRISLTSLLFSFSLMKAASRQWDSYPETVADLEALTKLPPAAQPETQAALKS